MLLLLSMADGFYTDLVGVNSYSNMHLLAVGNGAHPNSCAVVLSQKYCTIDTQTAELTLIPVAESYDGINKKDTTVEIIVYMTCVWTEEQPPTVHHKFEQSRPVMREKIMAAHAKMVAAESSGSNQWDEIHVPRGPILKVHMSTYTLIEFSIFALFTQEIPSTFCPLG
jgi:hypothetical protein